jgi:hypothetical protein
VEISLCYGSIFTRRGRPRLPAKLLQEDLEGVEPDLLGDSKFLTDSAKKYSFSLQALTFRLTYLRYITG